MAAESPISEQDLVDGLTIMAEVLQARGIQYALIGGMAAGYRSQPRSTKDIDFLLQVPQIQLPALLQVLQQRGFQIDQIVTIREWTQHHMAVISYRGIRVDWLKPAIPTHQHILDRATDEPWFDRSIRVASVEGLILLKLLANRTQDLADIEKLVAIHRDTLDLDWIRTEWQSIASSDDPRMVRFLALVSGENRSLSSPI